MVLHYCKKTNVDIFLKVLPQQDKGFKTSSRGNTFKRKKFLLSLLKIWNSMFSSIGQLRLTGKKPAHNKMARGGKPHCSMNIQNIVSIVSSHKGANLKATWEKPLKTRKGVSNNITKRTAIVVRGGVDYDNIGVVQEKRENGELPSENAGLPWGQWVNFPYHIEHKGTDYARFYPASGIKFTPHVQYFIDGVETDKATIQPLCLASEFPVRDEEPLCFTIKAENVVSLG